MVLALRTKAGAIFHSEASQPSKSGRKAVHKYASGAWYVGYLGHDFKARWSDLLIAKAAMPEF
jgi:hypothetical protein